MSWPISFAAPTCIPPLVVDYLDQYDWASRADIEKQSFSTGSLRETEELFRRLCSASSELHDLIVGYAVEGALEDLLPPPRDSLTDQLVRAIALTDDMRLKRYLTILFSILMELHTEQHSDSMKGVWKLERLILECQLLNEEGEFAEAFFALRVVFGPDSRALRIRSISEIA